MTIDHAVFVLSPDNGLRKMVPSAPKQEDLLQSLIATFPELLDHRREGLLLVQREKGVAGEIDGSSRWSLDNLYVTRSGVRSSSR